MSRTDLGGNCPTCTHKVYLVIAPEVDYHWYRQDSNGKWSHKRGTTPAQNVDASGAPIPDPKRADSNYGGRYNYSVKCGYLCAPN